MTRTYVKVCIGLTIFLVLVLGMLWGQGADQSVLLFASAYLIVYIARAFILGEKIKPRLYILYIGIQLILAIGAVMFAGDFLTQTLLFVLLGDVAYNTRPRYGVMMLFIAYFAFVFGHAYYYSFPPLDEIGYIFPRFLEYIMFFGLSYLAQVALQQKRRLEQSYQQLEQNLNELEEKAVLQERTRISREIHDTVGHTLTSAITGLQTAIRLLEKDQQTAKRMMVETKDYITDGLQDVRRSVHLLREVDTFPDLSEAVEALINSTAQQTGKQIRLQIEGDIPRLQPKVEMTLYRAIQEGLTNGIRHGNCSHFNIKLTCNNERLQLMIEDNGRGWSGQKFGFGLSSMQARVEELGGRLEVCAGSKGKGTLLMLVIPSVMGIGGVG